MQRILLLFIFLCPLILRAQETDVQPDTADTVPIEVDYADSWTFSLEDTSQVQRLIGDVQLRKDTIFIWCDSAYLRDDNYLRAMGRIALQQGDSIRIFADSMVYFNGLAQLFGDVILENKGQKLFTDRLDYRTDTQIGSFFSGGILVNGQSRLSSKKGYYYVESQQMFFKDSVQVKDPRMALRSDTLGYNMDTEEVTFFGPTRMQSEDSLQLYTERGYYIIATEEAKFWQRAQFAKEEQQAQADTIRYSGESGQYILDGDAWFRDGEQYAEADKIEYFESTGKTVLQGNAFVRDSEQEVEAPVIRFNRESGNYKTEGKTFLSDPPNLLTADKLDYDQEKEVGFAIGHVVWSDTSADLSVFCDQAEYQRETGYLKASGGQWGRPYLRTLVDGDSLFMAADTLYSTTPDSTDGEPNRVLTAFPDVRLYKSDLQGLCDSLVYRASDSLFYLFTEPVLWSDTSQFTADTMTIRMKNQELDKIFLKNKALILNSPDLRFFNQIQGREIDAYFEDSELRRMDVSGNAISVYYALDDEDAYMGVNKVLCSEMNVFFGNNRVDRIHFLVEPKGEFLPMEGTNHEGLKLKGFNWETRARPDSFEDLFRPASASPLPELPEIPDEKTESIPAFTSDSRDSG